MITSLCKYILCCLLPLTSKLRFILIFVQNQGAGEGAVKVVVCFPFINEKSFILFIG